MHVVELDKEERASFERAMQTIREMSAEDQWALLEHAVATSIRYATQRHDETLRDWARGLLSTIRLNASKAYRQAVEGHEPPKHPIRGVSASSILAAIRR